MINKRFIITILVLFFLSSQIIGIEYFKSDIKILKRLNSGEEKVKILVKYKEGAKDLNLVNKESKYKNYQYKEINLNDLKNLEKNDNIERIIEGKELKLFLAESTRLINSSYSNSLKLDGINLTGEDITVCVIDTGIDFSHPELINKNASCIVDCYNKECVQNCSLLDDHGHGTHVAGIISASGRITGVSPNAKLIGVKIINSGGSGSGNPLDLSRAIDYCASQNVSVISMSLGTSSTYEGDCSAIMSPWTESIDSATQKNISVIIAAGNNGNAFAISSPACIMNAIAVGSIRKDDITINDYNRNDQVYLLAPGVLINSTYPGGGFYRDSGTSMATPHVSGAFAIINQFLRKYNISKTPSEIEMIFNLTGKRIYDSISGLNYSRIDIKSALLSLDNYPPVINLIIPTNNKLNLTRNQTFLCNASDMILKNITFFLWNQSLIVYTESKNISGEYNNSRFTANNLEYDNYRWNCFSCDQENNCQFNINNFSLYIGGTRSELIYPTNNNYYNQTINNLSCIGESNINSNLNNISLFIWNESNSIVHYSHKNITGFLNRTVFYHNISEEGRYSFNCLVFNNQSNSSFSEENNSFYIDKTPPTINILSPEDNDIYNSNEILIDFRYNITENYIKNCSILINDIINESNNNPTEGNNSFQIILNPGTYYYKISCYDLANNFNLSAERVLTINQVNTEILGTSQGNSGGGGAVTQIQSFNNKTLIIDNNDLMNGYFNEFKINDIILFKINEISYQLKIIEIKNDQITIQINNLLKIKLILNSLKKINLSSNEIFDIEIEIKSINENKTGILIKGINEKIITSKAPNEIIIHKKEPMQELPKDQEKKDYTWIFIILAIFIMFAFGFIEYFLKNKNRKKREVIIKEYRERFYKNSKANISNIHEKKRKISY